MPNTEAQDDVPRPWEKTKPAKMSKREQDLKNIATQGRNAWTQSNAELVRQGIKLKEGRFSQQEMDDVFEAVHEWSKVHDRPIEDLILDRKFGSHAAHAGGGAWQWISSSLEGKVNRSVRSIYRAAQQRLRRTVAGTATGRWTEEEDRRLLKQIKLKGQQWVEMEKYVGRMSRDCKV